MFACHVQIKELSTRYSEFISFPIEVWAEKTTYDQVPDLEAEVKEGEKPKMKTVTRTAMQWEVSDKMFLSFLVSYVAVIPYSVGEFGDSGRNRERYAGKGAVATKTSSFKRQRHVRLGLPAG